MIKENLKHMISNIESASGKSFEDSEIKLIAITKNHPIDCIIEAIDSGVTDIGENRVQELTKKMDELDSLGYNDKVNYHMVGSLQTNKVRQIIGKVKLIHSLDRISLAKEIEKRAKANDLVQDVLIQVNVSKEETKSGFYINEVKGFIEEIKDYEHIKVKGLMTMAPHFDNPEETSEVFRKLKNLFEDISTLEYNILDMEYLSMGMTNDYEVAVREGSNMVRIGTGIFGEREY